METTVKERIMRFIKWKGIPQYQFERVCGMSNGYLSNLRKAPGGVKLQNIIREFPELNTEWLLYGEGEMLKENNISSQTINQQYSTNPIGNIYGNPNINRLSDCDCERIPERSPIIPDAVAQRPHFDVLPFVENQSSGLELSSIRVDHMPITMWYRIQDASLEPRYSKGDLIALSAYPQGKENPIPGKLYAIDTYSNGMVVRLIHPVEGGFVARAINRENYPDFLIDKDDVIRIYKKMLMVRF